MRTALFYLLPLLALAMAYWMHTALLWSFQPLFLFLGGWLWLVLLLERNATSMQRHRKYIHMALLSGVMLWLGFPSPGLSPILLVALVPLLSIERDVSLHHGGVKKAEIFKLAFCSMLVWNILSTYWVANSTFFGGLFAVIANSLLMTLPWILGHIAKNRMPQLGYSPLVCFWLSLEYLHFRWDVSWPWLTLGNGFASFHRWVQWYDILGALGGSLWIWVCNLLFFRLWNSIRDPQTNTYQYLAAPLFAILLPVGYSLYEYYQFDDADAETVSVVCIQPNQEPHYEQGLISDLDLLESCMAKAGSVMDSNVQYLIFPEAAFGAIAVAHPEHNELVRALRMIANMEFPGISIVAGFSGFEEMDASAADLPSTKVRVSGTDSTYYQIFNGALHVYMDELGFYKKSKLVIGAEYMPFGNYLGFLEGVVSRMGGSLKGFATQTEREVFASEHGKVGPVICYEQEYGDFMGGYVRKQADFLAIITNDGWWGKTDGFRQHREFARLRAIELRRSIARAANTGSSCFINARGDISQATPYGEFAAIKGEVSLHDGTTYYARMGDVTGRLAGFLSLLALANMIVRRRVDSST